MVMMLLVFLMIRMILNRQIGFILGNSFLFDK